MSIREVTEDNRSVATVLQKWTRFKPPKINNAIMYKCANAAPEGASPKRQGARGKG